MASVSIYTRHSILKIAVCSTLLIASSSTFAMEGYKAVYAAQFTSGISISGKLVRTLSQNDDNTWLMADDISASLVTIKEKSRFKVENNTFKTLSYHYYEKKVFKKRSNEITFDWSKLTASNSKGKTFAITDGTLDSLNYQLKLQQDLKRGVRGSFHYQIVKKDKLDSIDFIDLGKETITTALGKIEAIKLQRDRGPDSKRKTFIWLDPSKNFIITKLKQTEPDGKSYSLVLEKYN